MGQQRVAAMDALSVECLVDGMASPLDSLLGSIWAAVVVLEDYELVGWKIVKKVETMAVGQADMMECELDLIMAGPKDTSLVSMMVVM